MRIYELVEEETEVELSDCKCLEAMEWNYLAMFPFT